MKSTCLVVLIAGALMGFIGEGVAQSNQVSFLSMTPAMRKLKDGQFFDVSVRDNYGIPQLWLEMKDMLSEGGTVDVELSMWRVQTHETTNQTLSLFFTTKYPEFLPSLSPGAIVISYGKETNRFFAFTNIISRKSVLRSGEFAEYAHVAISDSQIETIATSTNGSIYFFNISGKEGLYLINPVLRRKFKIFSEVFIKRSDIPPLESSKQPAQSPAPQYPKPSPSRSGRGGR